MRSRFMGQGSWIKVHGSRFMDQGSWIKVHGSRFMDHVHGNYLLRNSKSSRSGWLFNYFFKRGYCIDLGWIWNCFKRHVGCYIGPSSGWPFKQI